MDSICALLQMAFDHSDVKSMYLLSDGKPDTSTSLVLREVSEMNTDRQVIINSISFNCEDRYVRLAGLVSLDTLERILWICCLFFLELCMCGQMGTPGLLNVLEFIWPPICSIKYLSLPALQTTFWRCWRQIPEDVTTDAMVILMQTGSRTGCWVKDSRTLR